MTSKVGPKGQVVIPKKIRDRLGIHPGDVVLFSLGDGEVKVRRAEGLDSLRGIFADSEVDLGAELLKERRRDREREEAKYRRLTE